MTITKRMIDDAEQRGACSAALCWLEAEPRTVRELGEYCSGWLRWAYLNLRTSKREEDRAFERLYDGGFVPVLPLEVVRRSVEDLLRRRFK